MSFRRLLSSWNKKAGKNVTEAQQVLPSMGETPQGWGHASFAIPEKKKCLTRSKLKKEGSTCFRIQGDTTHGGSAGTVAEVWGAPSPLSS